MPDTEIRCLLIPISGGQLLLPSTVVAEVSPYHQPERMVENPPSWLLGAINWRHQRVPLLSLEEALSLPPINPIKKQRIILLYGIELTQTIPFYAFIATDVPRTLTITEDNLTHPNVDVRTGLVFNVKVNNSETAWLPDLNYLENLLNQLSN